MQVGDLVKLSDGGTLFGDLAIIVAVDSGWIEIVFTHDGYQDWYDPDYLEVISESR